MPGKAYLSILQWPDELDDDARVEALVAAAGLDPFLASQRVRRGTPLVACTVDADVRESVLDELRRRGVLAIAPSGDEIAAVPAPFRAKRLIRPEGAPKPMFLVEPWRGEPEGLLCEDVFLIIRARLDHSTTTAVSGGDAPSSTYAGWGGILGGGAVGTGVDMSVGDLTPTAQTTTRHGFRHVLDLYTRDSRRVRCDSDKFNFDVLGKNRGLTDLQNSRQLADLIRAACPRASVDEGFPNFRASADILRSFSRTVGDATVTRRDDAPAFEFYSAWSYCLHTALRPG